MTNIGRFALVVVLMMVSAAVPAFGSASATPGRAGAGFREGRFLLAPQAFLTFCRVHPGECREGGGDTAVTLDSDLDGLLRAVNARVNRGVAPVPLSGPDVWALGRRSGHCATYAVQKRHELLQAGLPAGAVSLAVVTTASGELHLVVAVRTDRGALVLDNLRAEIRPWLETGYRFEKVQSAANPSFWVSVSGPAAPDTARVFALSRAGDARPSLKVVASAHVALGSSATSHPVVRFIPADQNGTVVVVLAAAGGGTS